MADDPNAHKFKFPQWRAFANLSRTLLGLGVGLILQRPTLKVESRPEVKTKRVDRVDLSASAFAYVGDPENTATWKLPIYFPGDNEKTRNHVKTALARFREIKGIPEDAMRDTWMILRGAAMTMGIRVEHSFTPVSAVSESKAPPVVTEAPAVRDDEAALRERATKELIALADYRADMVLKQMGLE